MCAGADHVAAAGLAWFMRMPAQVDYVADVLPGLLVFSLGLALVALGGLLGLAGIVNPRRTVSAAGCAGGQLVGAPEEVALPRARPAAASPA